MTRRLDLPTLRAALWAFRALGVTQRYLVRHGLRGVTVPRPPPLPYEARRGVTAVLRRRPGTCLERALVLQRWDASQGNAREVVIGVRGPTETFLAHAWLDGEPDGELGQFEELLRLPAT